MLVEVDEEVVEGELLVAYSHSMNRSHELQWSRRCVLWGWIKIAFPLAETCM